MIIIIEKVMFLFLRFKKNIKQNFMVENAFRSLTVYSSNSKYRKDAHLKENSIQLRVLNKSEAHWLMHGMV